MHFKKISDLGDLQGKIGAVRVDLNLPVQDGKITDLTRLEAVAPTIRFLRSQGARLVLLAHFGRPKGEDEAFSLKFLVPVLADYFGEAVDFLPHAAPAALLLFGKTGLYLRENTRFLSGEEKNDPDTARAFIAGCDFYVNDAFSCAHRAHASTEAITRLVPSAAGLAMEAELDALERALANPKRPVVALVGGAKISSKIDVLRHLTHKVDHLIIGGGMANSFFYASSHKIGASLAEKDMAPTIEAIQIEAKKSGCQLHLPIDSVQATAFKAHAPHRTALLDDIEAGEMILDAGPLSVKAFEDILEACATLVWNGPLGAFELAPFDQATSALAQKAAALTREGRLLTVAGGGDTVAALAHAGVLGDFSHISTAGGAFLEWMEGRPLPGVEALRAG